MVKHTQTIRRLLLTNCLSVFDHFMGLAPKGLGKSRPIHQKNLSICKYLSLLAWLVFDV